MNNPNDREINNQEVRQESYTDANGNRHTHVTRTTSTDNNSYQSGYVHGRNTEHRYHQADLAERDENTASGLLLGVLLTSLIGLTVGAFWYFNQQNATVDSTTPVETPASTNVTPVPTATITAEPQPPQTTIIERTREVPVVIPQPSAPDNPQINVTVPPQPPRTETSPNVAPSNPPTLNNGNNTSTRTPATSSTASPSPQDVEPNSSSSGAGNTNQNNDADQ